MITTPADFVGDITIAQVEQANVEADVQTYIDRYEPEYLREVMGYLLFKDYMAGITTVDPVYVAIRDGGEFTDIYGSLQMWGGLKRGILLYVYYHYVRSQATLSTGTGEKVVDKGGSSAASSIDKQVRAWNEMYRINIELLGYLYYVQPTGYDTSWFYYPSCMGLFYSRRRSMFQPINSLNL